MQRKRILTRTSFFTLLISPVFTHSRNAAQSASVTLQFHALISSLSKSNTFRVNFSFAMEHANEADGPTLCRSKVPKKQQQSREEGRSGVEQEQEQEQVKVQEQAQEQVQEQEKEEEARKVEGS
jgi:hypothetical protein